MTGRKRLSVASTEGGSDVAEDFAVHHAAAHPVLEIAAHWMATGFELGGIAAIAAVSITATTRFMRGMAGGRGGMP